MIGATAGRTTLAGEGLQHQDGHSHLMASTIPNCVSYDPTFHYELAVIFREGLKRMHEKKENIFFYITTMNENYPHPEMPKDKFCEEGNGTKDFSAISKVVGGDAWNYPID